MGPVQAFEVSSEGEVRIVLERLQQAFDGRLLDERQEHRRYLDTFDWRVHRSGAWLGEVGGHRPKGLLWAANGREPLEVEVDRSPAFAEDLPEGKMRRDLTGIVAPRRLMPVAAVERRTRTLELLDVESKTVCRIRAITNEIAGPSGSKSSHRILLEGVRGYDEELKIAERFIRYQLRLQPTEEREIDEVLSCLDVDAGRNPSALEVPLSAEMTASEAVRQILIALRETMVVNRPGVVEDLDTEFLHDLRVAVRRTRSVLAQLGQVLPATAVVHYQQEFRWVGELTGPARDLDVFLLNLPAYARALPNGDADALDDLARLLRQDRRAQQKRLVAGLRAERFEKLLTNWKTFLQEPASSGSGSRPAAADRPAVEASSRRIWKRYRKVRKIGRSIDRATPSAELHSLRIQCKKLRYLLEVFRSLYPGKPLTQAVKELKRLQNTLGEFNDAQVHADMLREFAARLTSREGSRPEAIVAIGLLISHLLDEREKERERFFHRFENFDIPDNHHRFRSLFAPSKERKS